MVIYEWDYKHMTNNKVQHIFKWTILALGTTKEYVITSQLLNPKKKQQTESRLMIKLRNVHTFTS